MLRKTKTGGALLLLVAMTMPGVLSASSVRHMNLDALAGNAGLIFRGTVVSVEAGTAEIGGASLPTTTYGFRVLELFKGEVTASKAEEQFISITMVGSVKAAHTHGGTLARFDRFHDIPRLQRGAELLLFTTVESEYGLSVTVGLAQGCFDIDGGMALNRAGNVGLFQGTAYAGPASGPIAYNELAERIRATLASR